MEFAIINKMIKKSKNLFNFRAPVVICLCLILGVLSGVIVMVKSQILLTILCCFAILGVCVSFCFKNFRKFVSLHKICAWLCLAVFLVSAISVIFAISNKNDDGFNGAKTNISGTATVVRVVDHYIIVENIKIKKANELWVEVGDAKRIDGNLLLAVGDERLNEFNIGDDVAFKGYAIFKSQKDKNGELNLNYVLYNSRGSCTVATGHIEKTGTRTKLDMFSDFRRSVKLTLEKNMNETASGLAFAMLFGEDDDILDLYQDFSKVGIAHIIAVSGLNIMFLATLLLFLAKLLKMNNLVKFIFVTGVTFVYVWMCGFVVSAVRAFIMSTVAMLAMLRGKQYDSLNSLALSAIIILIASPFQLFSKGFQLSFSAVLGILLLAPVISRTLKPILGKHISGALALTISATIFTLPIMLKIYPDQSAVSLCCNLIVVPLASFSFISTIVALGLTAIMPFMAFTMAVPEALLSVMIWIAKLTAGWTALIINYRVVNFVFGAIVLLSALISDYVFVDKRIRRTSLALLAIVFVIMLGVY